jgi:predicted nucleotidyltransferase component of viral defense system
MHDAIKKMLEKYNLQTELDYTHAIREILQEIALLGLWRIKFFEHAAFYGGSALRILYGLDRYSEGLEFSLLKPDASFSLQSYGEALAREINSFGFDVSFEYKKKTKPSPIDSAFLKSNTYRELINIKISENIVKQFHKQKILKIKIEVDIDPPGDFYTETKYVLQPMPFAIQTFCLPDLFAGKLHALLFRKWKTRVKGRDWYDLVWYTAHYPEVRLSHLEARMRQTGDFTGSGCLTKKILLHYLDNAIDNLDIDYARSEVSPFVKERINLALWSVEFFRDIVRRIVPI